MGLKMPIRDLVAPIIGFILIGFSIYIFLWALQLMIYRDVPSSLLATLIGFASLGGGVSLIRTWSLGRYLEKAKEEESARGSP
jgi:divalent metal cation (Fe/Co/Zn/Cd) transporter